MLNRSTGTPDTRREKFHPAESEAIQGSCKAEMKEKLSG